MRLMEHGLSSLRKTEPSFPCGLRVLVVDDDPTWLKILEKMLKKCSYEVTTSGLAREALRLLREKKDGFDIVISDVNMPDMDGFKLLEHVGLEMDLPVIMMSVDGETSRVMKGVQHGACDYLLKPIRMKELKNIWQHVLRKRMHEIKDTESHDFLEEFQFNRHGMELYDDGHFSGGGCGGEQFFMKKRKDSQNKHDEKDSWDSFSSKKPRVMWSVDLHQKFVKAVDQIGFDKVGPKKILDLMNIPWLTRENVASHLQKYRLYLSRLQQENEGKKSGSSGSKKADDDHLPKDTSRYPNPSMQSSSTATSVLKQQQTDDAFGDNLHHQPWNAAADSKLNEVVDLQGTTNFLPLPPSSEPQSTDNLSINCHNTAAASPGTMMMNATNNQSQHPVDLTGAAVSYPWVTPSGEFDYDFQPCHKEQVVFDQGECDPPLYQWDNCCDYPPLLHFPTKQPIIQSDESRQSSSFCETNTKLSPAAAAAETQLLSIQNNSSSNDIRWSMSMPMMGKANQSSSQPPPPPILLRPPVSDFSSSTTTSFNMRSNNNLIIDSQAAAAAGLELGQVNQALGFGSLSADDGLYWCQGDDTNSAPRMADPAAGKPGFSEHDFPQFIAPSPLCMYGVPRFDLEPLCDCMEYPAIDQRLPIS